MIENQALAKTMQSAIDYAEQTKTNALLSAINGLLKYKPNIIRALKHSRGTHTFDDVVMLVVNGSLKFWDFDGTFVITEFVVYPQKSVIHIFLAGGKLDKLIEVHPILANHARELGCSAVTLDGRSGWSKVFEDYGWEEISRKLQIDVTKKQPFDEWGEDYAVEKPEASENHESRGPQQEIRKANGHSTESRT